MNDARSLFVPSANRLLDDAGCERVLDAVWKVLENTGCLVKHEEARELLSNAGCTVDGELVKIPRGLMLKAIESAKKDTEFALFNRDGVRSLTFNPGESHFGPSITTVFLTDPQTGERRRGTRVDAANTVTLVDALPNIEWASTIASINDGLSSLTDLYEVQALLENTNKPIMYWAATPGNLDYEFEMFSAVAGSMEKFAEKPFALCLVCPLDPLIHTEEGCEQLLKLARANAPVVYIAGTSMGLTGPISIAGGLVVGIADALVGLLISQLANPGAPFVVAKFSDNVNMRTVATYHSGPEFVTANMATAAIFRYLKLPFCLNFGDSDSGIFDEVGTFDAAAQIQAAMSVGSSMNFASGCVQNGMCADYRTLICNNEMIGYFRKLYEPFDLGDESFMLNSIDEVGAGGNFLAEDETLDEYADQWKSEVFKPITYEDFNEQGKPQMGDKLMAYARDIIAKGTQHPLDKGMADKVDAIVKEAEAQTKE
ncbi:MAG: trimethylamine methyltransferase family protein [Coriobacteriales bacterium]|jgi:trimethylamine--corrinoid protein Co-methyltransferase